ncbi:MAG: sel1 repeat family protein [Burkholderiaceae bacterium]
MDILYAEESLRNTRRLTGTIHIVPSPPKVSNPGMLIEEGPMRFITHAPRTKHRVRLAVALALVLARAALPAHAAAPEDITPEQAYQLAREARTERDYLGMLAMLRRAGEAGDLRAQELLAGVLLAGPALYGSAIAADPCEAALWARRAAAQHSRAAGHYRELFNGMREAPGGRAGCVPRSE